MQRVADGGVRRSNIVARVVIGQDQVDGGQHPPRRRRADAVAAEERIQQALRDPVVQIRDEVFALDLPPLHLHEVAAARRENADDDGADLQLLRGKDRAELVEAVTVVQQIVHEDDRAAEGLDGADLIAHGVVAGVAGTENELPSGANVLSTCSVFVTVFGTISSERILP